MDNLFKENYNQFFWGAMGLFSLKLIPPANLFGVEWAMNLIFEVEEDPIAFYLFETSKEDLLLFW